jgi:hypothetical protein
MRQEIDVKMCRLFGATRSLTPTAKSKPEKISTGRSVIGKKKAPQGSPKPLRKLCSNKTIVPQGILGGGQIPLNDSLLIFQHKTAFRFCIGIGGGQKVIEEFPVLKKGLNRIP